MSAASTPRVDWDAERAAHVVASVAAGDRQCEEEFVLHFLPRVRAMLQARLRDPDRAADLQQEVLMEALRALRKGQVREPEKLSAFVLGIARNVLYSHFRRKVREPEGLEFPDDLPDMRPAQLTRDDEQRAAEVAAAIESLDPTDRSILRLTFHDGLKPGEIARRLGLNSDVVRQRKTRATRRLTDLLRPLSQTGAALHIPTGRKT